jgi:hypothetical protein
MKPRQIVALQLKQQIGPLICPGRFLDAVRITEHLEMNALARLPIGAVDRLAQCVG